MVKKIKSMFATKTGLGSMVLVCALLSIMATDVYAIDMTGTYEGRLVVTSWNDHTPVHTVQGIILEVTQVGTNLYLQSLPWWGLFYGKVWEDNLISNVKAEIALLWCGNDTNQAEAGRATATVAPNGTAVLQGTSVYVVLSTGGSLSPGAYMCNWNFRRISTDDPQVLPCIIDG